VSYILDALRKLERERQVPAAAPYEAAVAAPSPVPRQRLAWPLIGGAALAVNVILIGLLLWSARAPQPPVPQDVAPAPKAGTATTAPPGGVSPAPVASPPVASPPAASPSVAASVPARVPADVAARAEEPDGAPADPPKAPLPGRRDAAAVPPPGPAKSAPTARRPTAGTPPTEVTRPGERKSSAPATVAAEIPAGAPRLRLEVLVYSDSASERFVFINGRKFTEGQRVDEGVVLERIQPDSAILSYQDQKFVLRQ
jgi:general secretion pathway protein B